MPKNFNMDEYNNATPPTGDDYQRIPAGGYVCAIQAVRVTGRDGYGREIDYPEDKMYVKLIWDIIEGDFAGKYSDEFWADEDKDYGHCFYLSWKNMNAFKGAIQAIEESNPGFDAMAAFSADNWALFTGKKIGLVIGEEEYRANDGSIKRRYKFPRAKSVQDIRDGKFRVPALKQLEDDVAPAPTSTGNSSDSLADVYNVPF